eukprot:TRINITY_DN77802_c0_g1_i1.p1 TRINITY_DN77802_c0_g1~~TRINITY_DN77802_c0_g1_i1.p1  ORF type:complete len:628 (+),score=132.39 TRINITY_DN77802_c0_g1_i1:75-1958(+)
MADQKEIQRFIGRINRSGVLSKPISCSDVIEALVEVGTDAAESILGDVEAGAETIREPTNYILAAVSRYGVVTDMREKKSNVSRGAHDSTGQLGKAIGRINKTGNLQEKISFTDVVEILSELDVRAAMKILGDLEASSSSVRSPTAYIISAARRALAPTGSGKGSPKGSPKGSGKGPGKGSRKQAYSRDAGLVEASDELKRKIGWLNHKIDLQEKISYSDVIGPLSQIHPDDAFKILNDLQAKASSIKQPTSWILAAAGRRDAQPMVSAIAAPQGDESRELGRKIGWLNKNANLNEKISYSDVIGALSQLQPDDAFKILNDLEAKASSIRQPTSYILAAASRRDAQPAIVYAPPPINPSRGDADSKELGRKIGWINKNCDLSEKISYSDVIGPLSQLPTRDAFKILSDLEARASTIRNPTAYIVTATGRSQDRHGPPAVVYYQSSVEIDPTGKLARQIGWLNKNVELKDKLLFDEIVEPLSSIDVREAMVILKDVELNAAEIKNPTGYVLAAAGRKSGHAIGASTGGAKRVRSAPAPPALSEDDSKSISRQVGWLNRNAGLADKISYSDVAEPLSALEISDAMKILKDLEKNAGRVKNPTAYVAAAAAKRAGGDDGSSRKRQKLQEE